MGVAHPKPLCEYNDILRSLRKTELVCIQKQFKELSGSTDLKTGRVDKTEFVAQVLNPLLHALNLSREVTERIWFVLDYSDLRTSWDYYTFLHACYVLMFSAREEKFKFVFNLYDLSATGRIAKKEFRKMLGSFLQPAIVEKLATGKEMIPAANARIAANTAAVQAMEKRNKNLAPLIDMYTNWCFHLYDKQPADGAYLYSEWRHFAEDDEQMALFLRVLKPIPSFQPTAVPSVVTLTTPPYVVSGITSIATPATATAGAPAPVPIASASGAATSTGTSATAAGAAATATSPTAATATATASSPAAAATTATATAPGAPDPNIPINASVAKAKFNAPPTALFVVPDDLKVADESASFW